MGWGDPVVGGVDLRRAAIRSPNYVAGSAGWTINQDGSVEFNNGTFRGTVTAGTFIGTNYIQNGSGIFEYDGTPALGNLISSDAVTSGTDSFGNAYLAGFTTYNHTNHVFVNLHNGQLSAGPFASSPPYTPDTTDAMLVTYSPTGPNTLIQSHLQPASSLNDAAQIQLFPGAAGLAPPQISFRDALSANFILAAIFGVHIYQLSTGVNESWHAAGAAANWTIGSLQYRNDGLDNLVAVGSLTYTGANVAAAGGSVATTASATAYHPVNQWKAPCAHYTSTSVQKNTAATAIFNTNGTISIQWGDGVAGSAHDVNGLATGDIFWIESRVPLGNIA